MSIRAMRKLRVKQFTVKRVVVGLVVLFALIQLIPYGRSHGNPPVTKAPKWDSAQTQQLVAAACNDCHSNLSKWRWYDDVAPASWLVQRDIDGGRHQLNFSEWDQPQPSASEVAEVVRSGEMPPIQYKILHAAARLSKSERERLARGIEATYAKDPPPIRQGRGG